MKEFLNDVILDLIKNPLIFTTAGSRKIFRNISFTIKDPSLLYDLKFNLEEIGYKHQKMTQLVRHYLVQDQIDKAIKYLKDKTSKNSYGSTSITHHGIPKKNVPSDFCMTSTTFTILPKKGIYIDVHWRSTELIKRGRADFIFLRDKILNQFQEVFNDYPIIEIKCHFVGLTIHPMYFIMVSDSIPWKKTLESLKVSERRFYNAILCWNHRYLIKSKSRKEPYSSAQQVIDIVNRKFPKSLINSMSKYTEENYKK